MSVRLTRFIGLLKQADHQTTQWLIDVLQDKASQNRYFTVLARLACLRTLICREGDPCLAYSQRKAQVRARFNL